MEPLYYLTKSLQELARGKWEKHDGTYESIVWKDSSDIVSKKIIDAKAAEIETDYVSKQYQRDRANIYPEIKEQLDMLWHAIDSGTLDKTSDFYTTLKKVKDDNPKP